MAEAPRVLRVCLDLNVFIGAELAKAAGRTSTATRTLLQYAERGVSPAGPIQLVISVGMLDRLRARLIDRVGLSRESAERLVDALAGLAELGPAGLGKIVPVGTGVLPIHDEEDRGVLETALGGRADFLVTANWKDFRFKDVDETERGRVARYREVVILHTEVAVAVLSGRRALPMPQPAQRGKPPTTTRPRGRGGSTPKS